MIFRLCLDSENLREKCKKENTKKSKIKEKVKEIVSSIYLYPFCEGPRGEGEFGGSLAFHLEIGREGG